MPLPTSYPFALCRFYTPAQAHGCVMDSRNECIESLRQTPGERIGIPFVHAIDMVSNALVNQLPAGDRARFKAIFTMNGSKRFYKLFAFSKS